MAGENERTIPHGTIVCPALLYSTPTMHPSQSLAMRSRTACARTMVYSANYHQHSTNAMLPLQCQHELECHGFCCHRTYAGASRKGLSPTGAHMQRLAPWDPHSPPMPVRTMAEASVASVSAPKGGAAEGARTIADEQEPASSAAPASPSQQHGAYVDAHGPPSPPGYRAVHGLWRPDTAGVDAAVLARVTAEEAAQAAVNTPQLPQLPRLMHAGVAPAGRLSTPTVNILQALQDVTRPKTTLGHGCGFELGPRITALPIEQGLPRRSVPAVGK